MSTRRLPPAFRRDVLAALGPEGLLEDPALTARYGIDWTGRFVADPPVVARPADDASVVALVEAARHHGVALVAQGGNTGLVGGGTPMDGELVVDTGRLDQVVDVDQMDGQVTVQAGVTIAQVAGVARTAGWDYGVDLGSRGSATVGGTIATDAGGLRFVRWGGTRHQLLGVRAVLGNGSMIDHLPRVQKDNTGPDLGALLCGSEGTLGILTAARLRLVPPPGDSATAMVGFSTVASAVVAATSLRLHLRGLGAVELMTASGLEMTCAVLGLDRPIATAASAFLLVEADGPKGDGGAGALAALASAIDGTGGVVASAVATDSRGRAALWRIREGHTEAISRIGSPHKLDVSIPIGHLAEFIELVPRWVAEVAPEAATWLFGHAADGNVHVNLTGLVPEGTDEAVLDLVLEMDGSISAEHGIGRAKARWFERARSVPDRLALAAIRRSLDPDGVMNPAVLR